jgi:hypothetical protein
VRENLWNAWIRFQAGNVTPVIWIDAICINQSSDTERNHQVAKMKMIYEQAREVVVWLGESYDNSDLALQFVEELCDHRKSTIWIIEHFSKPDIKESVLSLLGLLQRDYWRRIWIVQELTVAKKIRRVNIKSRLITIFQLEPRSQTSPNWKPKLLKN